MFPLGFVSSDKHPGYLNRSNNPPDSMAQPTPAQPAAMQAHLAAQTDLALPTPVTAASPIPQPIFTTPRLIVRPLHPQDAPSMSQHANNPKVTKYMSLAFPSPYTLDTANEWIAMNQSAPIHNWGICLASAPNAAIGGVGMKPGADVQDHAAEAGFWIGEAFWGQGLTTEVLAGLTEWCFTAEEAKLATGGKRWTRLFGTVFAGNVGSMRCFEKCGYLEEGVLRGGVEKNGVASDLHVFGLVKGDWEAKRGWREA
ncbi:uncharacterized protein EKO05_0009574 [Ascochyta rabiei]|uniref:uncharacterized protein n=1 Tax=Didymella rabiei TaxID=5454 RepID=UPI0021FE5410|nr:uncharacterized protein EKO05_0009574 [Ascochyta rabiei]UPX19306.1 hypothetical protein EKO05_0009574 [Ascochyta rabiei]